MRCRFAFDGKDQREAAGIRGAEVLARPGQGLGKRARVMRGPEPAAGGLVEELGAGHGESRRWCAIGRRHGVVRVGRGLAGCRRRHGDAAASCPEGPPERGGILEPVRTVLLQSLHQHAVQCLGDLRIQAAGELRDFPDMLVCHGNRAVPDERRPSREHFVQQATGGVKVAASIHGLAAGLLRRQVLRGSHDGLGLGHGGGRVRHGAGYAEVHDLDAV
ncbi:hypothetical protein BJG92_00922 [Arthrobacter sp. SO5]|nr:hypothetical protein [Arthrobacter sp. SO5]